MISTLDNNNGQQWTTICGATCIPDAVCILIQGSLSFLGFCLNQLDPIFSYLFIFYVFCSTSRFMTLHTTFFLLLHFCLTSAVRPPTPLVMSTTVVVTFPSFTTRVVILTFFFKSSLHLCFTIINTITN